MDVTTLMFKIQSDFSSANDGLDSFLEKFAQVDTLADNMGKKISESIGQGLASTSNPHLEDLLPTQTITKGVDQLKSQLSSLFDDLSKVQTELQQQSNGGQAFTRDIDGVKQFEDTVAELYGKLIEIPDVLDRISATKGTQLAVTEFNKLVDTLTKIKDEADQVKEGMDSLLSNKEMQFVTGWDKALEAMSAVKLGIGQTVDSLSVLQSNTEKLGEAFASLGDSPFFKGAIKDQLGQVGDLFKQLEQSQSKLNDMGAGIEKAFSGLGAVPDAGQIKKLEDGLAAYKAQAEQVVEIQKQLNQAISDTSGIDRFMAAIGSGALKDAQSLLSGLTDQTLAFMEALARTGDSSALDRLGAEFPKLSEAVKQAEENMALLPDLVLKAGEGGADGFNALREAVTRVTDSEKILQETMAKIASTPEIRSAVGLDAMDTQLKSTEQLIGSLEQQLSGLKDKLASLQDNPLARAFSSTQIEQFSGSINKLEEQLSQLQEKFTQTAEAEAKLNGASGGAALEKMGQTINQVAGETEKLGAAMQKAANQGDTAASFSALDKAAQSLTLSTALLSAGFLGWFTVLQDGMNIVKGIIDLGNQWQEVMAQMTNATGLSGQALQDFSSQIISLSAATGQSAESLAKSAQLALQLGYNTSEAMNIVSEATKAAIGFQQDQIQVTDSLIRTLKDWGASASEAANYESLIDEGAIKAGVSVAAFGKQLGDSATIAHQFNISADAMAADLAVFVRSTGDATGAGNALQSMFTRLNANSPKIMQDMAEFDPSKQGLFSPEALHSVNGMQTALEAIMQVGQKFPQVIKDAFSVFGSENTGFKVTTEDGQQLTVMMADLEKAFQSGQVQLKAFNTEQNTTSQQMRDLGNNFATLGRGIGSVLSALSTPVLKAFNEGLVTLINTAGQVGKVFSDLGVLLAHIGMGEDSKNLRKFWDDLTNDVNQGSDTASKAAKEGGTKFNSALADGLNDTGNDIAQKIATSVSAIAKGIEDGLKLLAQAKNVQLPENIDDLIKPLADALKHIYDTFANDFANTAGSKNMEQIAQTVSTQIKALTDMATLLKNLSSLDVTDQSDKIDSLVQAIVKTSQSISKAFTDAKLDPGTTATNGDLAKSIADEIKTIDDVAKLYKDLPDAQAATGFDKVIQTLVDGTVAIAQDFANLSEANKKLLANATPISADVTKEVEIVKSMAALYKDLPKVELDPSYPVTIGKLVEETAALVTQFNALDDATKKALATATPISDNVSKMVTVVKDVADLYKVLGEQDTNQIGDISGVVGQLAKTAGQIASAVEAALPEQAKAETDLGAVAESVGKQTTMLKNVAELYKSVNEVDLSVPVPIGLLSATAKNIADVVGPELSALDQKTEDNLAKVADSVGKQVNTLKTVAELIKAMAEVDFSSDPTEGIKKLAAYMQTIEQETTPFLASLGKQDYSKVAESVSKEAEALKNVAELLNSISQADIPADPTKIVDQLVAVAEQISNSLDQYLGQAGKKDYSKLATSVGDEVKAIDEVVKVLGGLMNVPEINEQEVEAKLQQVIDVMENALTYFDQGLKALSNSPKLVSDIANDGTAVFKALGEVIKTLDANDSLPKFDSDKVKQQIDNLINLMLGVLEYFDDAIGGIAHNPLASKIATDASDVFKAVEEAIKTIDAVANLPKFSSSKLEEQIDSIIKDMLDVLNYFDAQLVDIQHNPKTQDIAKDATEVMKGIGETVKTIVSLDHLPTIDNGNLKQGIDALIKVMKDTLVYFDSQLVGVSHDPLVSKIATDMGDVMKSIDDTLKVFETLGSKKKFGFNEDVIKTVIDGAIKTVRDFMNAINASGINPGDLDKAAEFAKSTGEVVETIGKLASKPPKISTGDGIPTINTGIDNFKQLIASINGPSTPPIQNQPFGENQISFGTPRVATPQTTLPAFPTSQTTLPSEPNKFVGPPTQSPQPNPQPSASLPETTLNVDLVMDGDVLARSLNNKMFNNQTLRAQVVPTPNG